MRQHKDRFHHTIPHPHPRELSGLYVKKNDKL